MVRYIVRRLLLSLLIVFGITMIVFTLTYVAPADPAHMIAGPRASKEVLETIRRELALDQSLLVQYTRYFSDVLRGDLGKSWRTKRDVSTIILERLPATTQLAFGGICVELLIGLVAGFISAVKRGELIDRLVMIFSLVLLAAPSFWLGLILLFVFAFRIPLFPLGGSDGLKSLVLPAFTLGIHGAAWYARLFRSTLLDVLGADYVRTARAKGVKENIVLLRHVVPNSMIPVITMLGMDLGNFLGGVVVVEAVFAWPGLGMQAWQALRNFDIPVIMGIVIFAGFAKTILNLVVDVTYSVIDPRIHYE